MNLEQLREDAKWARLAANPTQERILGTTAFNVPLVDEEADRLTRLASAAEELARLYKEVRKLRDELHADGQRASEPLKGNLLIWAGRFTALLRD